MQKNNNNKKDILIYMKELYSKDNYTNNNPPGYQKICKILKWKEAKGRQISGLLKTLGIINHKGTKTIINCNKKKASNIIFKE